MTTLGNDRPGMHRWIYLPPILFWLFLAYSGGHPPGASVWIPVAIVVAHMVYPTTVGWALFLVAYLVFVALVAKLILGSPNYGESSQALVFQVGIFVVLVAYVVLLVVCRPKRQRSESEE